MVSRVAHMNDARRPAGRAMTVGDVGVNVDAPCPECGGDAFSCACEPVRDVFSADDVAQAVERWRKRADTAVRANEGYRGLVDDLKAEVRDLKGMGPSSPVVVPKAANRPVVAPVAAASSPVAPVFPGNLGVYLANLVDPQRIAYATDLARALLGQGDAPAAVDAPWFAKVDAKVRRLALVHVGR